MLALLLNIFYRTGVPCYPVVEQSQEVPPLQWKILGWVTRDLLDPWMADLNRVKADYPTLPKELLVQGIPRSLRENLNTIDTLPVIDVLGVQVATYSYEDILSLLQNSINDESALEPAQQPHHEISVSSHAGERVQEKKARMSSLILGSIPLSMFAIDLEGNTLFYNKEFEKNVLSHGKLNNSIQSVEKYFRELSLQILTKSYGTFDKNMYRLFDASLNRNIQMSNLVQEGRIVGYLFIVESQGSVDSTQTWRKRLQKNGDLQSLIEEIESRLIFDSLGEHDNNVSHTAKSLGLKRSTLQTKLKTLKIKERFSTKKSPVASVKKKSTKKKTITKAKKKPPTKSSNLKKVGKKNLKQIKKTTKKVFKKITKKTSNNKIRKANEELKLPSAAGKKKAIKRKG